MDERDAKAEQPCSVQNFSGYILINNGTKNNAYIISSNHPFFKSEYIKVYVDDCSLIFSVPTIDYNGKMYKPHRNRKSIEWYSFGITNELLITGKFYVDIEESTEDELVVYYR